MSPRAARGPAAAAAAAQPSAGPEPRPLWPALAVPASTLVPARGPRRRQLEALGLHTVEQVLRHVPRRYLDRTVITPIAAISGPGDHVIAAVVTACGPEQTRSGRTVLRARFQDGSGAIGATWFHDAYLARRLVPGLRVLVQGPVSADPHSGRLSFHVPDVEPLADGRPPRPPGLVPVYPLAAGLRQGALRAITSAALQAYAGAIPDGVPQAIRSAEGLMGASAAWREIHRPTTAAALEAARRAIVFEELLRLALALSLRRRERAGAVRGFANAPPGALTRRFLAALPYRLTGAQRRVLAEIDQDLAGRRPMYRLVQGDVGCGKTVVAAAAILRCVESGRQAALLAPTEILAEQHAASLGRLTAGLCRLELLTGSTPRAQRQALLRDLAQGRVDILVGTHALLQPDVVFPALGLAVTDEQHRFGVRQRDALSGKGDRPDVLVLSATPIPRTLAMTLYGDLDVSVIDELPPGRQRVRTAIRRPQGRGPVYDYVRAEALAGHQAYVVCPLITGEKAGPLVRPRAQAVWEADEPGEPTDATLAASAEAWAAKLATAMPDVRVGLLHGRMRPADKEQVMARFVAGEIGVLVATTVVEVGVDVPNATMIVIEDAERFGLAQLHQLRGRVGRGNLPSFCALICRGDARRLQILTQSADGFAIAEEDLRQRGPGEALGTRQHGLPELALADPARDLALLERARLQAAALLAADPQLRDPEHAALQRAVADLVARPLG